MNEKLKITPVSHYPECPTCPLQIEALQDAEELIKSFSRLQLEKYTAGIYCHSITWNLKYTSGYDIITVGLLATGGGKTGLCPHFSPTS
jgi:hypothetical protein